MPKPKALKFAGEILSTEEMARLTSCEATIERGITSFQETGAAVHAILTERLYRATHRTAEAYFSERFGISRSMVYQLANAAEVARLVPGVPRERVARQLGKVAGDPTEVFHRAVDMAGGDPKRVTSRHVAEADAELSGRPTETGLLVHREAKDHIPEIVTSAKPSIDAIEDFVQAMRVARAVFIDRVLKTESASLIVDPESVLQFFLATVRMVKSARPHASCGYCNGSGRIVDLDCSACRSRGWITQVQYDNIDPAHRGPLIHEIFHANNAS